MAITAGIITGGKNSFLTGMKDSTNLRAVAYTESGGGEIYEAKNISFNAPSSASMALNGTVVFNIPEGKTVDKLQIYSSTNSTHNPTGMNISQWQTNEGTNGFIGMTINPVEEFVTAGTLTLTSLVVNIVDPI